MQFLIDTATDSPIELYKIGRFLCDQFEVVPAPAQDVAPKFTPLSPAQILADVRAGLSQSAPPPPAVPSLESLLRDNDDPEIEIDTAGNVTSVTVSTELPAAPPPPSPAFTGTLTGTVLVPAPLPSPPGPAVPAELDKRGMPWDARIHAANRSQTIKGEWKSKRGVDDNLVAACEAQNKPGNVAPAAVTIIPSVTAAVSSAGMTAPPAPPVPFVPAAPPPPVPTLGTVAPAAVVPSVIDFRGLMQKIQAASAAGKLTPDQVNAVLAGVGLRPEEMAQLINNAPLIASVNAAVEACLV